MKRKRNGLSNWERQGKGNDRRMDDHIEYLGNGAALFGV